MLNPVKKQKRLSVGQIFSGYLSVKACKAFSSLSPINKSVWFLLRKFLVNNPRSFPSTSDKNEIIFKMFFLFPRKISHSLSFSLFPHFSKTK